MGNRPELDSDRILANNIFTIVDLPMPHGPKSPMDRGGSLLLSTSWRVFANASYANVSRAASYGRVPKSGSSLRMAKRGASVELIFIALMRLSGKYSKLWAERVVIASKRRSTNGILSIPFHRFRNVKISSFQKEVIEVIMKEDNDKTEGDYSTQLALARHNLDNLQALIRASDTKAAAFMTLPLFLGGTAIPVIKDSMQHV